MPYFAGERHAGGRNLRGHHERHVFLQGEDLQGRVVHDEPVAFFRADPAHRGNSRRMIAIASSWRSTFASSGRCRAYARRTQARRGRSRRWRGPPLMLVELHHALGDIEGVMIGQRDHAGAELDAFGAFRRPPPENIFRRGDGFPSPTNGARRTKNSS